MTPMDLGPVRNMCPTGCGRPMSVGKTFCLACWRQVPIPEQSALYRARARLDVDHSVAAEFVFQRALDAAVKAVS
jgi:hypothetical protein